MERLPPVTRTVDFPVATAVAIGVVMVCVLLVVASRFDPTHGPLTISLLLVLTFIGALAFCLLFTVPQNDETAAVIGGLTAAIGAVVAFWLGGHRNGGPPSSPPPEA